MDFDKTIPQKLCSADNLEELECFSRLQRWIFCRSKHMLRLRRVSFSWMKLVHYFLHHRPFMHKETFQEVDLIKYPNWRMFLHVCSDFFVSNCWTIDSHRHAAACCTSGVTAWDFQLLSNELLWSHSFQFVLGMLTPKHAHPKLWFFHIRSVALACVTFSRILRDWNAVTKSRSTAVALPPRLLF